MAWSRPFELGPPGKITPVNQLQWDPATNTAYAKPDQPLEQGRLYAILVTNDVKDWNGQSVTSSEGFTACTAGAVTTPYCLDLRRALQAASGLHVVGGSVFTTLSATAWLESAAAATRTAPGLSAHRGRPHPQCRRCALFTWRQHTSVSPAGSLFDYAIPVTGDILTQAGVGRIAFGSFKSPRFLAASGIILRRQLRLQSLCPRNPRRYLPRLPALDRAAPRWLSGPPLRPWPGRQPIRNSFRHGSLIRETRLRRGRHDCLRAWLRSRQHSPRDHRILYHRHPRSGTRC